MNIRILLRKVILRGHGNERNFVKLQLDIDGGYLQSLYSEITFTGGTDSL